MSVLLRRMWALLLVSALLLGGASAEVLALPEQLAEIGEEAFANDASISEVVIPDGAERIGARAFAGCKKLGRIAIPGSVTELGADFLKGCSEDVLIETEPGSAALRYARANQIDYRAGTAYRALLIGQTYKGNDAVSSLSGPANDVQNLSSCLRGYAGTPYQIDVRSDLTADGIRAAIREAFGAAGPEDVSLFYYSGHGVESHDPQMRGALFGCDGRTVTADELRRTLDEIPGRKIVLIDACFSGNLLSADLADRYDGGAELEMTAEDFVDSFIAAFGTRARANLAGEDYFVMTAASDEEMSYESNIGKNRKSVGLFTSCLLEGCGFDVTRERSAKKYADSNGNGDISLREAFDYVYDCLSDLGMYSQHAQLYPSDSDWFGILRE